MVTELNFHLLENFRGWTVVLQVQRLLHRLFHWKSLHGGTDRSVKTTKLFHLKQFAIYGMYSLIVCKVHTHGKHAKYYSLRHALRNF